ncbi:unnamed protein product [Ilex paraguariensis]|uniref:Peptidase A1 domain-containing protein n=1 Tax=Ilex paraguariensis TaxID=185542 RepID=A0ABC8QTS2_9AQUA
MVKCTGSEPFGFSLKLIPWDSPESPLYPGNLTQLQKIQRLVSFSESRSNYLASISSPQIAINPDNIQFPVQLYNLQHTVSLKIGIPITEVNLLMDTGSASIWTQCATSKSFFAQEMSLFDPKISKTYAKLPCKHPICRKNRKFCNCITGPCICSFTYGNGAFSPKRKFKVTLSSDTFHMPLKNQVYKPFPNMTFGCSKEKLDNFSGTLGMGKSLVSLISQLRREVQGRFSYCFHNGNSYLRFGEDIPVRAQGLKTTPLVNLSLPLYYLNLIDISVGTRRLKFSRGFFSSCTIDSGTPFSVIAGKAYSQVIRAFAVYYFGKLDKIDGKKYKLELCYNLTRGFQDFASITFHFREADLVTVSTYIIDRQAGYMCVALKQGGNLTVLGALQQWDKRFIYDINANTLQFFSENCSKDRGG